MKLVPLLSLALAPLALGQDPAPPAGKMWLYEEPPLEELRETYGFEPAEAWREHKRLSSLRWDGRGSASFVSPDGLILTNHHCVKNRLPQLGSEVAEDGYVARIRAEELPLQGAVANQLVAMEDVTARVFAGVELAGPREAAQRVIAANRQAVLSAARDEHPGLMPELQDLYRGARVHLYLYRNYTDLRLVFAPHDAVGYFGGHADNFSYPHYALDFALVRAYEDGAPVDSSAHCLEWEPEPVATGELVLSSGYPGSTNRHHTVAELELARDASMLASAAAAEDFHAVLRELIAEGDEDVERWRSMEFGVVTMKKSFAGRLAALRDASRLDVERRVEAELIAAVRADAELRSEVGDAWDEIELAAAELTEVERRFWYQTPASQPGRWFGPLLRAILVVESCHPDAPSEDHARARSEAASYAGSVAAPDAALFAGHLHRAREVLGADDPAVAAMLQGREPEDAVRRLLAESRIREQGFVTELLQGGWELVSACADPAIVAARTLYPLRIQNQEEKALLEEVIAHHGLRVGRAIDALHGPEVPPEATFGLRLSAGIVSGYEQLGTELPASTSFYGMFARCIEGGDAGDFDLPDVFHERVGRIDLALPLNFVSNLDIIGGNSGSPILNREGRVVGLIFDGNLQMVENRFQYRDEQERTIAVHAPAMIEALVKVYDAPELAAELLGQGEAR